MAKNSDETTEIVHIARVTESRLRPRLVKIFQVAPHFCTLKNVNID